MFYCLEKDEGISLACVSETGEEGTEVIQGFVQFGGMKGKEESELNPRFDGWGSFPEREHTG